LGPIPNPQNPNPKTPTPKPQIRKKNKIYKIFYKLYVKNKYKF